MHARGEGICGSRAWCGKTPNDFCERVYSGGLFIPCACTVEKDGGGCGGVTPM